MNFAIVNKVRQIIFFKSNSLKLVLDNRSFQYGNIISQLATIMIIHRESKKVPL